MRVIHENAWSTISACVQAKPAALHIAMLDARGNRAQVALNAEEVDALLVELAMLRSQLNDETRLEANHG